MKEQSNSLQPQLETAKHTSELARRLLNTQFAMFQGVTTKAGIILSIKVVPEK